MRVRFDSGEEASAYAYLDADEEAPLFGDTFKGTVKLSEPSQANKGFYWTSGWVGTAELVTCERDPGNGVLDAIGSVRRKALAALAGDDDASRVLQALVCGYGVSYEGTAAEQSFTSCGLAHIVAVSGAHLVIVGSYVGMLLRLLRLPKAASIVIQLVFMLQYLILTGMPVSGIRAYFMMSVVQISFIAGRRSAGLAALGCALVCLVSLDPSCALSASFVLSSLSTLGIGLFNDLISTWIRHVAHWMPDIGREALSLTLSSMMTCQLYSCALFSQLPLVSPLANMVVAPLIAPLCGLGIVAAGVAVCAPLIGAYLCAAAHMLCQVLCMIVGLCASLPFSHIPIYVDMRVAMVATAVLCVGLWIAWPLPRRRGGRRAKVVAAAALTACLVLGYVWPHLVTSDEIVMLDVGQGDAFLIRSSGGSILVDTGASESLLRQALARNRVIDLDAVLVTHSDDDHCGALESLGASTHVGMVLFAEDGLTCACESCAEARSDACELVGEDGVKGVETGDVLSVGRFKLHVLWPDEYTEEGGNADSVCLAITYGAGNGEEETVALFTGDAEAEQIEELLSLYKLEEVPILKVGHHGSKNALTQEQALRLSPDIALVSVGESNRYGHPAAEIISYLQQSGSAIYRTDTYGDVSCRFSARGIEVGTLR